MIDPALWKLLSSIGPAEDITWPKEPEGEQVHVRVGLKSTTPSAVLLA